jgi:SAM-dependent methyltransferase
VSETPFRSEHFRRLDERNDRLFYTLPRLVTHVDDGAIEAIRKLYAEVLPPDAAVLDLMSSWKSHLPDQPLRRRTVGLGLNETELRENGQLDAWVVHDVNTDTRLPFDDREFDAGVMAVSVQYLTQPVEVFRDARRVLRPGGPFIVTFSNRLFQEKAIAAWWVLGMEERAKLVGAYFEYSGGWQRLSAQDRTPEGGGDPLYAVWAYASGDPPVRQ